MSSHAGPRTGRPPTYAARRQRPAAVATEPVFVGPSNLIGVLGTLLTSSSTASKVLFAPLQETPAVAMQILYL